MADFAPRGRGMVERGGREGDRGGERASTANDRRRMLDMRRDGHLRYDLKEALLRSKLSPEQVPSFIATILSKGSRQSTMDAKDWVTAKMTEGVLEKSDRDAINTIIDRYSKWR